MDPIYFATFAVALLSSSLSGLAGGGGGFIMAPYWLISGMTPAQGATTGAFMALGMSSSSLAAYKDSDHMPKNKRLVTALFIMTFLMSLVGPFFLRSIHAEVFKPILAVMTIASLPFLFIERGKISLMQGRKIGFALMAILLLMSSFITSSVFSILMSIVLMRSFKLTVLQGTAMRRLIGIVQSAVIFVILCSFGNFILPHAIAALAGGSLGSYVGTKFSLNRGEAFARYALAAGAVISAVALAL